MVYTVNGVQYTRRKKIPVTGAASGAQTNFQIKLAATWAAAMQVDFDDVRLTKADFQTLIDAWLESKVDSTSANIWVEFPTTPADGVEETEAYMYFGNAGVASDWDGGATFPVFFDDFEDALAGDWTTIQGTVTYNSTGQYWGGAQSMYIAPSTSSPRTNATIANSDDIAIQFRLWTPSGICYPILHGNGSYAVYTKIDSNSIYYNDGAWHDTGSDIAASSWNLLEFRNFDWTAHTYDIVLNDSVIQSGAGMLSTSAYNDLIHIENGATGALYIDNVITRKYATNPPTYEFGAEEHQRRTPMMM